MGSSAASAVAAAVAVNALLESPLAVHDLLLFALEGEKYASGGLHADNVAPSLLGGLVLCPEVLLPDVVSLPVPQGVSAALLHPDLQVNTAQARRGLAKGSNIDLIGKTLRDVIIEPQRKENVPCFDAVKEAAMRRGALGCSLSGSGPSIFALCKDGDARNVASAMEQACRTQGIGCQSWVSSMTAPGARIESP
jgi:homoserine kinase